MYLMFFEKVLLIQLCNSQSITFLVCRLNQGSKVCFHCSHINYANNSVPMFVHQYNSECELLHIMYYFS